MADLSEGEDFYWEGPYLVFTAQAHLKKGTCCGSGCRHCPYDPRWIEGTTTPAKEFLSEADNEKAALRDQT